MLRDVHILRYKNGGMYVEELAVLGFLGGIFCIVMMLIGWIKRTGKAKKWALGLLGCFIVMGISVPSSSSVEESANTVQALETTAQSEEERIEQEQKVAEEKKKKEEEEKAKREAEEKAKAEEKARIAEEEKKSKNAELYQNIVATMTEEQAQLPQATYDFIKEHSALFPANTEEDKVRLNGLVDPSIEYKHLNKNLTPYVNKVIEVSGNVVKIEESQKEDIILTYVHFVTEDWKSFEAVYLGSVDAFEDDMISVKGIPVATNAFSNVSGGTTLSIVLIGGDIQKLQ